MSYWGWTIMAMGISFTCGWGAARHSRESASRRDGSAVVDERGNVGVLSAAAASERLKPAHDESSGRDLFLLQLARLNKPMDGRGFYEWALTVSLDELESVIASLGHSPEASFEMRQLVLVLAVRDPQAAVRRFGEWSEFGRHQFVGAVVAGWAQHDPRAALEWLGTQRTNAATDEAREVALRRWAQSDPQAALAHFREKGWQWDSPKALQAIFTTWVRSDPQRALSEWRSVRREFNPPTAPGAESPLDPFTVELVAGLVWRAKLEKSEEPVAAAFTWFEASELPQVPAGFWHHLLGMSDPETVLPQLEDRLESSKLEQVVGLLLRDAPEKRQSILGVLKNNNVRLTFESLPAAAAPAWSGSPLGPEGAGSTRAGEGGGFWEKAIQLDP